MIHVLNNLLKECDVILNGLQNHLIVTGDDALTIDSVCKKLNHRYKKIKNKKDEKIEKEKVLGAYNKQYKQWCRKCGKYGHKPGNRSALKIKIKTKKIIRKQKDMKIKIENLMECATILVRKGI